MSENAASPSTNGKTALKVSDLSVPVITQLAPSSVSSTSEIKRQEWGRSIEFILTLIGFCVGLGNVWRFPYLCYRHGGGAFLIPYIITLALVGLPMYYFEMSIGQFSSLGPIALWNVAPMFKGLGVAMVIIAAYIVCYYNVIVAWSMFYWFASMTSQLPWQYCTNWWNTPTCLDTTMNKSLVLVNGTINGSKVTTPSEEYYYNYVLRMSDGIEHAGTVVWQLALLLFVAWVIIFIVLVNGIDSVGKAAYFVSLFPYVLLTVLLIQTSTLEGALDGVKYYMYPQWEKLADPQAWSDAATQIFYSLGICMGSLMAMASFNKFSNNCHRDSIMIPLINCGTSIYAGFVVFTMLGYISQDKELPIDEVAKDGPGLVFVVYPEGLATLPVAPLWATLFFFMMAMLGFSSQFSMAEGVCAAVADEYEVLQKGHNPLILRASYCLLNFLLGLPMVTEGGFYIFTIMNDYTASYQIFIVALFEIAAISWIYGFRNFMEDIEMMTGTKPNYYWVSCWVGISPAVILGVFIFKCISQTPLTFEDYVYPDWANAIAWLIVTFPLVWIIGYMIYWHIDQGGAAVCVKTSKPTPEWGPALRENRTGRYAKPTLQLCETLDYPDIKNPLEYDKLESTKPFTIISMQSPSAEISHDFGFDNKAFSDDDVAHSSSSGGNTNHDHQKEASGDVTLRRKTSNSSHGSSQSSSYF